MTMCTLRDFSQIAKLAAQAEETATATVEMAEGQFQFQVVQYGSHSLVSLFTSTVTIQILTATDSSHNNLFTLRCQLLMSRCGRKLDAHPG